MNAKQGTKIEWTHHEGFTGETWNPVTGCTKVSAGCANCYAEAYSKRFWGNRKFSDVKFHADRLEKPLRWQKPRAIFVNSMSDLFHPSISFEQIAAIFGVMAATPQHKYMILSKRTERWQMFFGWMDHYMSHAKGYAHCRCNSRDSGHLLSYEEYDQIGKNWPLQNVRFGVSIEDQKTADERIPALLSLKAKNYISSTMVSIEPMLGPINLQDEKYQYCLDCDSNYYSPGFDPCPICGSSFGRERSTLDCLDWVIVGGESGLKARRMSPEWAVSIRDQCKESSVPFFFKQWGKQQKGSLLDGEEFKEFPQQAINAN